MYVSDLVKYQQEGNGVFLKWNNRFLVAVGNEKYWDKTKQPWIITYTSTGGHVEAGETREEAIRREVKEELGCEVELLSSDQTLFTSLEDPNLIPYTLNEDLNPILVYNSQNIQMSVCVYLGRLLSPPIPQQEVPAIILLPSHLLQGGHLESLLKNGSIIKEQEENSIPRSAMMKPFGSTELLVKKWDDFMSISCFRTL